MKDLDKDQTDLERLVNVAFASAADMFDDLPANIDVPSVCVFKGRDGVTPIFFEARSDRDTVISSLRAIFQEHEATAYAFSHEGWYKMVTIEGMKLNNVEEYLRTTKRPSEDLENRKPCFVITGADTDGNRIGVSYGIEVKGNRRQMTDQLSLAKNEYVKGVWAELLQPSTKWDVDSIGSGIHGLKE